MKWTAHYVGLRDRDVAAAGAPSPCWNLARAVYRGELGDTLPARSGGPGWREVAPTDARDFDLVLLEQGRVAGHVGVVAGPGRMLHLPDGGSSCVEQFNTGTFLPRLKGIYRREGVQEPPAALSGLPHGVQILGRPFLNPEAGDIVAVPAGLTLAEMVAFKYPATSEDQRKRMRVSVGRHDIRLERWTEYHPENWTIVTPHPGMLVAIEPLPGAIPFGRIIGILAVTAALAAGQFYLGPALATSLLGAQAAGTAAFNTVVGLTALTLATAVSIGLSVFQKKPGGGDTDNPAALGLENRARLLEPVANPLGVTLDYPAYGALPYIDVLQPEGDNRGKVVLHALFAEALGDGVISQQRLGETDVTKFDDGEGNPVELETFLVNPGDPWPFQLYDHTVVATDASSMGAAFEGTDPTSEWVERVAPRDCTQLQIILGFPSGLYAVDDSGDLHSTTVFFEWEYAPLVTEDWLPLEWPGVRTDERSPIYRSFLFDVDRAFQYKVRTRKTGREDWEGDLSSQATYVWMAIQGHRPEAPVKCRAPILLTACRIRSTDQLQGTIKAYNRIFSRKALQWSSGAWSIAETQNPAAGFRYKLQTDALAAPYADAAIDLTTLQEWSEYADANVLEYNSLGSDDRRLMESLNEIAISCRARTRRYHQKWGVVIDRPQDEVVGHITPANGWAISALTARIPYGDGFRVNFQDETSNYAAKTRTVPFPATSGDPVAVLDLPLAGVTDPNQVYREAIRAYFLMFEDRITRWLATAAWDHITFGAGERVMVDDGLLRSCVSAWVQSSSGNVVVLDRPVVQEIGKTYELRMRYLPPPGDEAVNPPPAQSLVRTVTTVPGDSAAVVLTGEGQLPPADTLVIFAEAGAAGIDCIVEEITGGDDLTGTLTLRAHVPDLDERIDALVIPAWDGRVGDVPGGPPADAPTGVSGAARFQVSGGDLQSFIEIGWNAELNTNYQISWRVTPAGAGAPPFRTVNSGSDATPTALSLDVDPDFDYEVSVRKGSGGTWSSWVAVPGVTLLLADVDSYALADADSLVRAN